MFRLFSRISCFLSIFLCIFLSSFLSIFLFLLYFFFISIFPCFFPLLSFFFFLPFPSFLPYRPSTHIPNNSNLSLISPGQIEEPIKPPKKLKHYATLEEGSKVDPDGKLFSHRQQDEELEALELSLNPKVYEKPSSLALVQGVSQDVETFIIFHQQPIVSVKNSSVSLIPDQSRVSEGISELLFFLQLIKNR